MMPLTCGRTSATREAATRPGSFAVSVTSCGVKVTTVTAGAPCCCCACAPCIGSAAKAMKVRSVMAEYRITYCS